VNGAASLEPSADTGHFVTQALLTICPCTHLQSGGHAGATHLMHLLMTGFDRSHQLHAFGTNIEGEWDEVMAAVKACHQQVHQMGRARVTSTLKIGTRTDREQSLEDKVDSVTARL